MNISFDDKRYNWATLVTGLIKENYVRFQESEGSIRYPSLLIGSPWPKYLYPFKFHLQVSIASYEALLVLQPQS